MLLFQQADMQSLYLIGWLLGTCVIKLFPHFWVGCNSSVSMNWIFVFFCCPRNPWLIRHLVRTVDWLFSAIHYNINAIDGQVSFAGNSWACQWQMVTYSTSTQLFRGSSKSGMIWQCIYSDCQLYKKKIVTYLILTIKIQASTYIHLCTYVYPTGRKFSLEYKFCCFANGNKLFHAFMKHILMENHN